MCTHLPCRYAIKNTTGYSINALADFSPADPIEILKRLMIGSEGTLGFVSQVGYKTDPGPNAGRGPNAGPDPDQRAPTLTGEFARLRPAGHLQDRPRPPA